MTGACLCAAACVSAGCSRKTLALFFDGVPPPRSETAAATRSTPGAEATGPRGRVAIVEHGPYAAKLCEACHDRLATNALVAPRDELCGRCHETGSAKRHVHGPFASGECLACHDPHSSSSAGLVRSIPGGVCAACHDRDSVERIEGHAGLAQSCTDCHDPHTSDERFLLR